MTTYPFGDVIDFQEGPGIMAVDFRDEGIPLVRLSGLSSTEGVLDGCNYLDPAMVQKKWQHFRLRQGDTLLSTSAALGRVAVVDAAAEGAVAYTGIIRMRPRNELLDASFIRYLLLGSEFQRQAEAVGVGSVLRHFGPSHLRTMSLTIPAQADQRKIAAILSAYDDLIENNNRRIKLLEEIARRIYREWFIDFRYPGHEDVPQVNSTLGPIPVGWTAGRWGQYATLDYGRALRGYKENTGQYPVFGTNGQIGWHNEALFPSGVVVGRKGAYRGIRLSPDPCWIIDTAFYLRLSDNARIDSMYAYHQLCTVDLDDIDSGSAIPSTSRDAFYAIPVVVPPIELVRRFSAFASDLDTCERALRKGGENLRASRDLLLPRLISGEIDVADLDIAVPEAAA